MDGGEVERLLAELVATPSVNPSLDPAAGQGEGAIAAFAAEWLRARGLHAEVEEVAPGRVNVHASGGTSGPDLCLCGHLDTVSFAGMPGDPVSARVEDGRLFGRGACDMKSGLAAAMVAAAALVAAGAGSRPGPARRPARGRVSLALLADEEYMSIGADAYVARHHPDACIVTEPTGGNLVVAHKGFLWLEVLTRGRAAHGSRWDLGVSAIGRMGPVVTALDRFDREVLRGRTAPLVGPASMHCAVIHGGTGVSTYAEECRIQVERRLLPGEAAAAAAAEIRQVVLAACPEAEVRPYFDRLPLVGEGETPVARAVRAAAVQVAGAEPETAGVGYWTDAAVFAGAGIPAVIYGAAGVGAHEAVEWVHLESVVTLSHVLVEAAHRFWAQGGTATP